MIGVSLAAQHRHSDAAQPIIYCPHCHAGYRKPKYETPLFCLRCGASFDIPTESGIRRVPLEAA